MFCQKEGKLGSIRNDAGKAVQKKVTNSVNSASHPKTIHTDQKQFVENILQKRDESMSVTSLLGK